MDDVSASLVDFKALLREKSFHHAEVAELADALASGASGRKVVEVRVLSSAPAFARLPASFGSAGQRAFPPYAKAVAP